MSKFTFGHKLDPWQIRVLSWIDAGKSVVICAPTSSGKTILSSYVAFIFKATASKAEKEEAMLETRKKVGSSSTSIVAKNNTLVALKEVDESEEVVDESDGEEGNEILYLDYIVIIILFLICLYYIIISYDDV